MIQIIFFLYIAGLMWVLMMYSNTSLRLTIRDKHIELPEYIASLIALVFFTIIPAMIAYAAGYLKV